MQKLPRLAGLDHSAALLRQGYGFIPDACDRLGSDGFRARIMLRDVVCLRGPEAVALVYSDTVTRQGSVPGTVLRLLQDKHSVQQQDGAAHRHRKALFLRMLMQDGAVTALRDQFRTRLAAARAEWRTEAEVVLIEAINPVLTDAVCAWVGLPDLPRPNGLADTLYRMSDRAGGFGPATWAALWRRSGVERWLRGLIADARAGTVAVRKDTPLCQLIAHRDPDGNPLDDATLAVELLNILRPVVAIGRYIAFAAMHLGRAPGWRDRLHGGDPALAESFAEEVRRLSPFFPAVGAITLRPVEWQGHPLAARQWVLCDLYGMLHDARFFPQPEAFDPTRAQTWRSESDSFVPQGGGKVASSHRCPGEWITVTLIAEAVAQLAADPTWRLPDQDLSVALNRLPARPASGVRLRFSG